MTLFGVFCLFEAVAGLVAGWWGVSRWTSPARKEAALQRPPLAGVHVSSVSNAKVVTGPLTSPPPMTDRRRVSPRSHSLPSTVLRSQSVPPEPPQVLRAMGQVEPCDDLPTGLGVKDRGCYWIVRNLGAYDIWMWTGEDYSQVVLGSRPVAQRANGDVWVSQPGSPIEYIHDDYGTIVEARWKDGMLEQVREQDPMQIWQQIDALKLASGDLGGLCDEYGGLLPPDVLHDAVGWPAKVR